MDRATSATDKEIRIPYQLQNGLRVQERTAPPSEFNDRAVDRGQPRKVHALGASTA